MHRCLTALVGLLLIATAHAADEVPGLVRVKSPYGAEDTVERLETALKERRMTVYASIDHQRVAHERGLALRPAHSVLFGNPELTTLLLHCANTAVLDLPLQIVVWEEAGGQVWLGYNAVKYLAARHNMSEQCRPVLRRTAKTLKVIAEVAAQPGPASPGAE